jgi:hypothetical protein
MLPGNQNDMTVGSFNWQSGPLGNFYLPPNSPLINANNLPYDPSTCRGMPDLLRPIDARGEKLKGRTLRWDGR